MLGRKRGGKVGPPGSQTSMAGMQKHSRGVNYARAMCIPALEKRGRVERRGHNIPAASCGKIKNHTIVFTARCRFPGAPRAVFEGLLRAAPGGLTVSGAPPWRLRRLSTASGPNGCPAHLTVPAAVASGAQWRAERVARLWIAGGGIFLNQYRIGRSSKMFQSPMTKVITANRVYVWLVRILRVPNTPPISRQQ